MFKWNWVLLYFLNKTYFNLQGKFVAQEVGINMIIFYRFYGNTFFKLNKEEIRLKYIHIFYPPPSPSIVTGIEKWHIFFPLLISIFIIVNCETIDIHSSQFTSICHTFLHPLPLISDVILISPIPRPSRIIWK